MNDILQYFFGNARYAPAENERRCLSDKNLGKEEEFAEAGGYCE
jgi:hypothetical protein